MITGCANGDGAVDPAGTALIRAHPGPGSGGMAAIVQGVVEVDLEVGCVWLSTPDGSRHPVVWPAGTSAEPDPFRIVLPDGRTVAHGDQVTGGGGYVPASSATADMEPFPDGCLQDGEAAVFNADSELEVTEGVGVEPVSTLFGRFSVPESIGLELIAVNPNLRSVAVADLVGGTVHVYETSDYEGPSDAVDGASGGGGFIHLWSQGTVFSYPGRMDANPLVYRPDPLREIAGVAPNLEVVPAPDGERVWLVQDGSGSGPTLVELVDLVEEQVSRITTFEIDGSWQPIGATVSGLVLAANEGAARTKLVAADGSPGAEVPGLALSVGWDGVAVLDEGMLSVFDSGLAGPVAVDEPEGGLWMAMGGPLIPTDAPPIRTGADRFLVGISDGGPPQVVMVDRSGASRVIYRMRGEQGAATWSRAGDWVAVIDRGELILVSPAGDQVEVGDILPDEHWVLTAG